MKKGALAEACECSEKTIQRTVAVLIANGWAIEYDRRGYYFEAQTKQDLKVTDNAQVAAIVLTGCSIDKHLEPHLPKVADGIRDYLFRVPDLLSFKYDPTRSVVLIERCSFDSEQLVNFLAAWG